MFDGLYVSMVRAGEAGIALVREATVNTHMAEALDEAGYRRVHRMLWGIIALYRVTELTETDMCSVEERITTSRKHACRTRRLQKNTLRV